MCWDLHLHIHQQTSSLDGEALLNLSSVRVQALGGVPRHRRCTLQLLNQGGEAKEKRASESLYQAWLRRDRVRLHRLRHQHVLPQSTVLVTYTKLDLWIFVFACIFIVDLGNKGCVQIRENINLPYAQPNSCIRAGLCVDTWFDLEHMVCANTT